MELNGIDSENRDVSANFNSIESKVTEDLEKLENEDFDPSYDDDFSDCNLLDYN